MAYNIKINGGQPLFILASDGNRSEFTRNFCSNCMREEVTGPRCSEKLGVWSLFS
jgi:hypothetical protein